ncbi:MAG: glutathione-disulfide reductase [Bacteriovoracaceae bacterium]|nr:glutathione-disulfide reductase [Bacteriovoracaceae bacterium]
MSYDYDLFVIGAGSGGVRAARWSAGLGAKVAICEEDRYGGTCVIRGCVPKKFMYYSSMFGDEMRSMKNYGWEIPEATFDLSKLKKVRDNEIERLSGIYRGLLDNTGVRRINGAGKLIDGHTVEVAGTRYTAKNILIAVGGKPTFLNIPGIEYAISSNEVFDLSTLPKKLVVVGGGFIGVEFAGIFNGLGSEVEVVIRKEKILRGFDDGARSFLMEEMVKKGITFSTGSNIINIEKGERLTITLDTGKIIEADQILFATGRSPKTEELNLQAVGVEYLPSGKIVVNNKFQSSISSIYAIGDCSNSLNLTPVATKEGTLLAEYLINGTDFEMDYSDVPEAIFSQPSLSSVGPTEGEASKHFDIDVYESTFRSLKHTLSGIEEKTYMKLIVDKKSDRVVACHMVGADASEIMQGIGIAVKAGLKKKDFDRTIGIHPSTAEEFVTMRTPRKD